MPTPWKPTGRFDRKETTAELAEAQPDGYTIVVTNFQLLIEWARFRGFPPRLDTEWRPTGDVARLRADIHMTPEAVDRMKGNEKVFAEVMIKVCDLADWEIAKVFFQLGHALYEYGLDRSKNSDGSLDIRITNELGAFAGSDHKNPILIDPMTCSAILQLYP